LMAQGRKRTTPTTSTLKAIPTTTHMALVQLQNVGILKYIISQNCDGLHRKSGISPDMISELHGNTNLEACHGCGKEYLRDFHTRVARGVHDHETNRRCDNPECNGELYDTIINFGETLPENVLQKAYGHAYKADLCIVLGSSLTVSPACHLPKIVAENGGKLVICNLQGTPLDNNASIRIYSKCDDLMNYTMESLGMKIPPFLLNRHIVIGKEETKFYVRGVDGDGTPFHFLQGVRLKHQDKIIELDGSDSYEISVKIEGLGPVYLELFFMGHYNELPLKLEYQLTEKSKTWNQYMLQWNPTEGTWAHFIEDCLD